MFACFALPQPAAAQLQTNWLPGLSGDAILAIEQYMGTYSSIIITILTTVFAFFILENIIPAEKQPLHKLFLNIRWSFLYEAIGIIFAAFNSWVLTLLIRKVGFSGLISFDFLADSNFFLKPIIYYFIFDAFYYWFHRLQHTVPFFWQQHKFHHADEAVSGGAAVSRHHWLEDLFRLPFVVAPMALLFDISPAGAGILSLLIGYWAHFKHANIRLPLGPLSWILTGPQLHRTHHSKLLVHQDKNFAAFFPIYDIIFGTYYHPKRNEYPPTGLSSGERVTTVWQGFWLPFVGWWGMFRSGPCPDVRTPSAQGVEEKTLLSGVSAGAEFPERQRTLDGLRGLAVLMILVWHWGANGASRAQANGSGSSLVELLTSPLAAMTWSGVDLFLVLSGYLIGNQILTHQKSNSFFLTFFARRFCRIFPLYAIWVCVYFLLRRILDEDSRFSWLFGVQLPDWSILTFTQNILMAIRGDFFGNFTGISWSIALEVQFYLAAPFAIFFLKRHYFTIFLIAMILFAPIWRAYAYGEISRLAPYVTLLGCADVFALGMLISVARLKWPSSKLSSRAFWFAGLIFIFGIGIGVYAVSNIPIPASEPMSIWGFSAFRFSYTALLVMLVFGDCERLTELFSSNALVKIGTYGYAIYLFHQPILGLTHGLLRGGDEPNLDSLAGYLVVVLSGTIMFAVASLSWRYIESPFLRLGHKRKYV